MTLGMLEQDRRSARPQHPVANLGHLQFRVHGNRNAPEFAEPLQLGDKVAQVLVLHQSSLVKIGKEPKGAAEAGILAAE